MKRMTDAHSHKHMAAHLAQVIDLHLIVAGNELAIPDALDKDFDENF